MHSSTRAMPVASVPPRPSPEPLLTRERSRTLCLFGGPYVVDAGTRLPVPEGSKRLLVFSWHAARELLGCVRGPRQDSDVTPALSAAT